jgi:hypothetical protein
MWVIAWGKIKYIKGEINMSFVTREKIKGAAKMVGEPFYVQAWDGYINIKKWSGKLRAQLLSKVVKVFGTDVNPDQNIKFSPEELPEMFSLMNEIVMISVCDENGNLLFDANNPEDINEVSEIDAETIQSVFDECAKRNGLLDSNLKEEIKNSETTQK